MFFLLRVAFWLTLVCVMVPGSKSDAPDAKIDAGQAITVATAAMSDARGFCERQPQACVAGGQVATAIGHKAEDGARALYQMFSTKLAEKPAETVVQKSLDKPRTIPIPARGTLTQSDLQPAWHEPAPMLPRRDPRTKPAV